MRWVPTMASALLAVMTGGCATIVNGGGQLISVNTIPMGASCVLDRDGQRIGAISSTPGTFAVDKSRKTIVVTCEKPGYQPVMASNAAHSSFTIIGNVVFGGLVGLIVDESTGADYDYANTMDIDFPPRPPAMPYSGPGSIISASPTASASLTAWAAAPSPLRPD